MKGRLPPCSLNYGNLGREVTLQRGFSQKNLQDSQIAANLQRQG